MDPVKEAFSKIKEDIIFLKNELISLKDELNQLKNQTVFRQNLDNSLVYSNNKTDNPTLPHEIRGSEEQKNSISIGNEGVQTDTSTYTQTVQHIDKSKELDELERVSRTLESLDSFKKDLRVRFKRLTKQEMAVFNVIFTLEEQGLQDITYRLISTRMGLSESSIRDYINKIIIKKIPLVKRKVNNKTITLSIAPSLKKLASLSTINQLRDI